MNPKVLRINLKTAIDTEASGKTRQDLIDFCLLNDNKKQYVAIGWSCIYDENLKEDNFYDYKDFYYGVRSWLY